MCLCPQSFWLSSVFQGFSTNMNQYVRCTRSDPEVHCQSSDQLLAVNPTLGWKKSGMTGKGPTSHG